LTSGCSTGNISQVVVHLKGKSFKGFSGTCKATNKMKQQTTVIEDQAYELETARKEELKRNRNLRRGINRYSSK
jgi:hypothetical protein